MEPPRARNVCEATASAKFDERLLRRRWRRATVGAATAGTSSELRWKSIRVGAIQRRQQFVGQVSRH